MKTTLVYALSGVVLLNIARADTLPALIDPNNPAKAEQNSTPQAPAAAAPGLSVSVPKNKLTPETLIKVDHIQFIGGTVYPLKELLRPFVPYAHKQVPLKTLIGLVNDITLRYRADGYPLSYAWLPDDNFQDGTLKIVLVEGYVAHSDIKSNNPNIAERLKRLAAKIMAEKPLTQATFDRYTQLMTRTPGVTVDANAQLPQNIYGAAAMQAVSMQPHIWDISSTIDTRRSQNMAFVNGSLSNLTSYGDQLGVATLIPLDSSTRKSYLGLNYQQFLTDEGLMMQLKGSFYREDPRDYSRLLNFSDGYLESRQKTTQYNGGAMFSYPVILTGKRQLNINGGVDYTDRRNDNHIRAVVNEQTQGSVTQKSHVRYPALELGMNGFQAFDRASINGKLTLRQGINASSLADAAPDGIVMPFAENYRYLKPLLAAGPQTALTARVLALGEAGERRQSGTVRPAAFAALTEREYALVGLMAQRLSNREIAEKLFLSEGSVKQYVNRIYSKLHIEGDQRTKRRRLAELLTQKS